jgi:cardiolipin synthase
MIWCGCAAAAAAAAVGTGQAAQGSMAHPRTRTLYRLVQYPRDGFGGFYRQIARARRTIDMEMYELEDPVAERDLVAAVRRGVRVRVLLDRDFSGGTANRSAARYLSRHGVRVRWAPPGSIFHIKATSFEGTVSDVSTANLTARYYRSSRDAEIVDSNPAQVRAIEATFAHDWRAGAAGDDLRSQTVQAPGLIWSPNTGAGTAETALAREIGTARHSVDFESEELADPAIIAALAADARRGVSCRIVMTRSSEWDAAFRAVTRAGCHVHLFPDSSTALYIHEKLILDDPGTAGESLLIGSQNASVISLTRNRELSLLLQRAGGGGRVIAAVAATFGWDYRHASPWTAPPSTAPSAPPAAPSPVPAGCHPKAASGNCYEPGEYCSGADHGMRGIAGDGASILCSDRHGWRWERT